MLTAGVDIGGTKVFAALVDERGSVVRRATGPTRPDAGTASIVAVLDTLLAGQPGGHADGVPDDERPGAIGIAAAAWVEHPSGRVVYAPNLVYEEPDLPAAIGGHFGLPLVVENDANAAAWAECQHGAGRGADHMLMLTVGTGIGGGVVIGGALLRGQHGFAAELGHITLVDGGPLCGCGQRGCLEALASGTAIGRMAREGLSAELDRSAERGRPAPDSILLELAGDDPRRITGALVSEAAQAGDEFAAEVLGRAGRWLGLGLANLVNVFDPAVIVIGGGGAAAGWFLLEPARLEMDRRLHPVRERPPMLEALLGNDAGAIGAASLARLTIRP
jgi:glucokinase